MKEEYDLLPIEELQALIGRGPNRLRISNFWAEIPESFARSSENCHNCRNEAEKFMKSVGKALFCRDHALFGVRYGLGKEFLADILRKVWAVGASAARSR